MIHLSSQTYGREEIDAVLRVLESGYVTMGAQTEAFEQEFAAYIGVEHAVMVNSGSSANLLMIASLVATGRLSAGDTVFAPALTWSTTIWPLLQYGLKVILVDCDQTLQMDPKHLSLLASMNPGGKAVFLAHIMGNPGDITAIKDTCNNYDMMLLEDSCECLGGEYMGMRTGRFGSMASFSFFFSHHMTTIEGGMVVTDDDELADYCRSIRSHGWSRSFSDERRVLLEHENTEIDPRFLFVTEGYNLRPTEIQAAMGRVQLGKLDQFNQKRAGIYEAMRLVVIKHLFLHPPLVLPQSTPQWFSFPLTVDFDRRGIIKALGAFGIDTRPIVAGNIAKHPAFIDMVQSDALLNADWIASHGLYWGLHPNITHKQIRVLDEALGAYQKSQEGRGNYHPANRQGNENPGIAL